MAIAAELELDMYSGDINTAYLSAWLAIRQYLRSINGYLCRVSGHLHVVLEPCTSDLDLAWTDRATVLVQHSCVVHREIHYVVVLVLIVRSPTLMQLTQSSASPLWFRFCQLLSQLSLPPMESHLCSCVSQSDAKIERSFINDFHCMNFLLIRCIDFFRVLFQA